MKETYAPGPDDAWGRANKAARPIPTQYVPAPPHQWEPEVNPLHEEGLTSAQLALVQPNPSLVEGMLTMNSLAWIAGAPGAFKTFLALELACHVATGTPYRGLPVRQGPTLYVTGEGRHGLSKRIRAWEETHKTEATGTWWLTSPTQVGTKRWDYLRDYAREIGAVYVVLDTQARMAGALEENSVSDMSRYIDAVDRLREATGACVSSVHHSSKAGETLRGSSAIHGAADTVIALTRMRVEEEQVDACRIHCMKQKDEEEFWRYWVRPVKTGQSITLMECDKPEGWDPWIKAQRRG